jgi:hypothetical protein
MRPTHARAVVSVRFKTTPRAAEETWVSDERCPECGSGRIVGRGRSLYRSEGITEFIRELICLACGHTWPWPSALAS